MPTVLRGHADAGKSGADMPTQSRGHGTRHEPQWWRYARRADASTLAGRDKLAACRYGSITSDARPVSPLYNRW